MSFLNSNSFLDRQTAAAKARKEQAEKFLSRPKYDPNDPAVLAREAARRDILKARELRDIERAKRKVEAEAALALRRADEEVLRLDAVRLAEIERQKELDVKKATEESLEFERKLDRDARYAARKERKKKTKVEAHLRYR